MPSFHLSSGTGNRQSRLFGWKNPVSDRIAMEGGVLTDIAPSTR